MAKITAMKPHKHDPDRVNIDLDGEFALSIAAILAAHLRMGQDLEPQAVASLKAADACELAFQKAAHFLSYRLRSEAEIRQYLRKHKTADDVIESTITRLHQNQYADDNRFARAWIENRSAFRPRGRRLLSWELRRKGLSDQVVEEAVAGLDESALAYEAAGKHARRMYKLPWIEFRTRLHAFLARRGFTNEVITSTVSRIWRETRAGRLVSQNEDTL
jgi:regulatory protein